MNRFMTSLALILVCPITFGGEVDVVAARAQPGNDGSWRFQVTLKHADTGWEHYADRWEILDPRGHIIATRVLAHPHVDEQPFTRGLSGVKIPEGTDSLTIRGHDKKHGYGGKTLELPWPPL
jgi:hypothetical protein